MSCDEKVISILDNKTKREYGDTLISFLKSNNLYKNSFASITLTEGAEQLKERLGAIMKFEKKSKTVITFTIICSVFVCACFLATGAYAAPSTAGDNAMWKDNEIRNEVLTEDGVYYIFCDGAGEDDKPQASVSVGSIQFVVVRKDSYTSIGPFDNTETLVEDVARQCEYMKTLTQEERELVIKTAAKIENNSRYTYVQRGYYSDSYIIEMGWNLNDTMSKEYADSKEITLEDNSTMLVYFGGLPFGNENGNAIDYLNDRNAVSAIEKLIYTLKNKDMPNYPMLETPLITNITYVGENNLSTLAEEYFESGNSMGFSAIFTALDTELQKDYCQKIYEDNKIALFSAIIPYMDRDLMMLYADKSVQDQKVNFFSVILGYMQSDDLKQCAEKCYEADNIAFFTVIIPYMTENEKQEWSKKAQTDKKSNFSAVLSNRL